MNSKNSAIFFLTIIRKYYFYSNGVMIIDFLNQPIINIEEEMK